MIGRVVAAELAKLRRSVVPWVTLVPMLLAPCAIGAFMWIVQNPGVAASLGLLGTKANLAGLEATWPAFSSYLRQVVGGGGIGLLGFVLAYLFGREYADGTARNMLALPVARGWFVLGKLVVATIWWAGLAVAATLAGLVVGQVLDLPGRTPDTLLATAGATLAVAGLPLLVSPLVAWLTIATRSYLGAVGFAFGTILIGDLVSHTGWSDGVPWSIVLTAAADPSSLTVAAVVVLVLTGAVGVLAAVLQLRLQDNP